MVVDNLVRLGLFLLGIWLNFWHFHLYFDSYFIGIFSIYSRRQMVVAEKALLALGLRLEEVVGALAREG